MSQTNLLKLDRMQNQAMRFILGTTKGIPAETMRFMLISHQCKSDKQVKAYFSAVDNPRNLLHEAVIDTKSSRLGRLRGRPRVSRTEESILHKAKDVSHHRSPGGGGVERESALQSPVKGGEKTIVNQSNINMIAKASA